MKKELDKEKLEKVSGGQEELEKGTINNTNSPDETTPDNGGVPYINGVTYRSIGNL